MIQFFKNIISDIKVWNFNRKNGVKLLSENEYIEMIKNNRITRVVVLTGE